MDDLNHRYITCRGKYDGVGAQVNSIMSTILFSRNSEFRYVHTPFQSIEYNYSTRADWVERWERFFNLGQGELEISDFEGNEGIGIADLGTPPVPAPFELEPSAYPATLVSIGHCLNYADKHPDLYSSIRSELRKKYWSTPKPSVPRRTGLSIAIHARRGDVGHEDAMFTTNATLVKILDYVESELDGYDRSVTLYSQGNADDFHEFKGRVRFQLNLDPFRTYHQLVCADILVTAKSSFSYSAAILNKGIIIYVPFWHQPMSDWIRVGDSGGIGSGLLREAIVREKWTTTPRRFPIPSAVPWKWKDEIINDLIEWHGYRTYLEIGLGEGANFSLIGCDAKVSVDPHPEGNRPAKPDFRMTSDEFFETTKNCFDLIFIDGLHHEEQVHRDILNALSCLSPGGCVVVHDLNPTSEQMQAVPRQQMDWTGNCWKAWVRLKRDRPDLAMAVVDTDYGVGLIFPGRKPSMPTTDMPDDKLSYDNFFRHRVEWLNLLEPSGAMDFAKVGTDRRL